MKVGSVNDIDRSADQMTAFRDGMAFYTTSTPGAEFSVFGEVLASRLVFG
jgi:hypothetical protein